MILEHLTLWLLRLPLVKPYKLAFGVIDAFDTIIVKAEGDGRQGFGEATILTGYTNETIGSSWPVCQAIAADATGRDSAQAKEFADGWRRDAPFAATAVVTAIEMMEGHPLLTGDKETSVALLAIVNETEGSALEQEIEARLEEGYGTLKVKVGFDPQADLRRVAFIQGRVAGRAQVRLDGNQGYDQAQAVTFAAALNPDGIELFEQPCPAGDWPAAQAVARASTVPMMLDESIYALSDIDRAARLNAARFIKLKLMKAGGLDRLTRGLKRIRELGMTPVLGNGVASEVGCWMEGCVAAAHLDNASEMNGFLKPRSGVFERPLTMKDGNMILPAKPPSLDGAFLARAALETAEFAGA